MNKRVLLTVVGLVCGQVCSCERVAPRRRPSPSKPTPPPPGKAPSPPPTTGVAGSGAGSADVRAMINAMVDKCVTKTLVKEFRTSQKRSPVIGISVQVPEADGAVSEAVLRDIMTSAFRGRGLPVRTGARGPNIVVADPRFSVQMSPGVRPHGHGEQDYFLEAKIDWKDEGRDVRRYEGTLSVVEMAGSRQICTATRTLKRRPSAATVDEPALCKGGPAWTTMVPCVHGGKVHVVGMERRGRQRSARRFRFGGGPVRAGARKLLVRMARRSGGQVTLTWRYEVPDSFECASARYVLLRIAQPDLIRRLGLPRCDRARVSSRSPVPKGCPAWVNRLAWREGRMVFGAARGKIGDSLVGLKARRNRLKAAADQRVFSSGTQFNSKSVLAQQLTNKSCQETRCGGRMVVLCKGELVAKP